MPVRIYHNPRCNTSRKTLALLREKGVEPEVVEYLKTPYTAAQLKTLLGQLKMPAKALIRKKEAAEAGIDPAKLSEDQLIAAMAKHPIVVERSSFPAKRPRSAGRPRRCWRCFDKAPPNQQPRAGSLCVGRVERSAIRHSLRLQNGGFRSASPALRHGRDYCGGVGASYSSAQKVPPW